MCAVGETISLSLESSHILVACDCITLQCSMVHGRTEQSLAVSSDAVVQWCRKGMPRNDKADCQVFLVSESLIYRSDY